MDHEAEFPSLSEKPLERCLNTDTEVRMQQECTTTPRKILSYNEELIYEVEKTCILPGLPFALVAE